MNRSITLAGAAAALALIAAPAVAQQRAPAAGFSGGVPQRVVPVAPRLPHPVSPYGYGGEFPSPRFYSELFAQVLTRQASFGHSKEVDQANHASALIDRGDCAGAEAYLRSVGANAMAERVPRTCDWKRRGLI